MKTLTQAKQFCSDLWVSGFLFGFSVCGVSVFGILALTWGSWGAAAVGASFLLPVVLSAHWRSGCGD